MPRKRAVFGAGALPLHHADATIGRLDRVVACFVDGRDRKCTVHSTRTLVGQRIAAIGLCYEDVDDHDTRQHDPVLVFLSERLTPKRQDCAVLAGKCTLNWLEHGHPVAPTRHHKIAYDAGAVEALFVELFLDAHYRPSEEIVLDLHATEDPLHGKQEGQLYHGYYDCYLPLHIFCGGSCWRPSCGAPTSTPTPPRRSDGSSSRSARACLGCALLCGPVPALPATNCWTGARPAMSTMSPACPQQAVGLPASSATCDGRRNKAGHPDGGSWPRPHPACRCHLRHDPIEAIGDRRAGPRLSPPHQGGDGFGLSLGYAEEFALAHARIRAAPR